MYDLWSTAFTFCNCVLFALVAERSIEVAVLSRSQSAKFDEFHKKLAAQAERTEEIGDSVNWVKNDLAALRRDTNKRIMDLTDRANVNSHGYNTLCDKVEALRQQVLHAQTMTATACNTASRLLEHELRLAAFHDKVERLSKD